MRNAARANAPCAPPGEAHRRRRARTPPGSGRVELRRGLHALAQDLGLTENRIGDMVSEELSGTDLTDESPETHQER
ncbi:MAG: hypothetical protein ACM3RP_08785 [Chitinophagales bacterium]